MAKFVKITGQAHEGQTREEFETEMNAWIKWVNKPVMNQYCDCKECGMKFYGVPAELKYFEMYFNTTKAQQRKMRHEMAITLGK